MDQFPNLDGSIFSFSTTFESLNYFLAVARNEIVLPDNIEIQNFGSNICNSGYENKNTLEIPTTVSINAKDSGVLCLPLSFMLKYLF